LLRHLECREHDHGRCDQYRRWRDVSGQDRKRAEAGENDD
jgi:hypothetical protein